MLPETEREEHVKHKFVSAPFRTRSERRDAQLHIPGLTDTLKYSSVGQMSKGKQRWQLLEMQLAAVPAI